MKLRIPDKVKESRKVFIALTFMVLFILLFVFIPKFTNTNFVDLVKALVYSFFGANLGEHGAEAIKKAVEKKHNEEPEL